MIRAKKKLGQHFLKDHQLAKKISDTLSLKGYTCVVEIGPGMGMLTQYLIEKPLDLLAIDVDPEAIAYLNSHFTKKNKLSEATNNHFKIIEADFLQYDLRDFFSGKSFAIIGNFPYNISTQIIFKVIRNRNWIPEFSGMFQKEVAQRICEPPGSKVYGILSVLTQAFYKTEYLFSVAPEMFAPPPKVQSGVIRLTRKDNYEIRCKESVFFKVVKTAFGQRRKTLRNSLKNLLKSTRTKELQLLSQRPEQLSVAQFIELAMVIQEIE